MASAAAGSQGRAHFAQGIGDGAYISRGQAEARLALVAVDTVFHAVERTSLPKRYALLL